MTWEDILRDIRQRVYNAHIKIKELAPQNSEYVGVEYGKLVNFIYVNGNRVYSNTNNLYNSVELVELDSGKKDTIFRTRVDSSKVPYYEIAVLHLNLTVYSSRKFTDYGSPQGSGFTEEEKENRNYLYYMQGLPYYRELINGLNGKTYRITDKMEDFI